MRGGLAAVDRRAFRKRHNLWLAYASEVAAPLLRGATTILARGNRTEPERWRNGLVIGHNHLGDVLYRTCSLEALRSALPNCDWSYLTSPASAEILENNPSLREVLPLNSDENSWNLRAGGFSELLSRRFDVVLCTNSLRHYPDFALATALGIPNRVGFASKGLSGMINHPVRLDFPNSYPAYFRSMVAEIASIAPDWPLRPRIFPGKANRGEAEAAWRGAGFGDSRPVLACTATTRQSSGNADPDVILSILSKAREAGDFDVALCGAPEDHERLSELARSLTFEVRIFAGSLGVLSFAAFLSKCAALLTVDSGPRHLGNAVGLPVVFARNLAQLRIETGKYCDTETDLVPYDAELLPNYEAERVMRDIPLDAAARVVAGAVRAGASRASSPRST